MDALIVPINSPGLLVTGREPEAWDNW